MKGIAKTLSKLLDNLSESLAERKGLIPLIGLGLVLVNLLIVLIFPNGFLARSDLFLHVGVIVAIFGLMLGQAL
jgi:hypothetical protein